MIFPYFGTVAGQRAYIISDELNYVSIAVDRAFALLLGYEYTDRWMPHAFVETSAALRWDTSGGTGGDLP